VVAATTPQRTIMVVEDEPVIRGLLSLTLEGEDYCVETAADGLEALDKVQRLRPDAIVLDLLLPKMDGWALIEALGGHPDEPLIPIVAVSASQRYMRVGEDGVVAFLSKPFDIDTLLIVLDEALDQGSPI
jgi:CheY-like chemotaxis protein